MHDPLGDGISRLELIDHMGSDLRVVQAARVSYAGDTETWRGEKDAKLIRYLIQHGHWSPFEHCTMTVLVKCPLFIRSQWHRHRSWAFNEISRRYTSEEIEFYIPRMLHLQAERNRQASDGRLDPDEYEIATTTLRVMNELTERAYWSLLRQGVAREQARMVLPQSLYTRFYATASLRSLLHFIQVRDHDGAQWEMVQYARALGEIVAEQFPVSWQAWQEIKGA